MLTLNLEKKWFDKIKAGQKTHEYRDVKPYFASRLEKLKPGDQFILRWGYKADPEREVLAEFVRLSVVEDGKTTDLKHNNPVYDIEFVLIKQERVNGASK